MECGAIVITLLGQVFKVFGMPRCFIFQELKLNVSHCRFYYCYLITLHIGHLYTYEKWVGGHQHLQKMEETTLVPVIVFKRMRYQEL